MSDAARPLWWVLLRLEWRLAVRGFVGTGLDRRGVLKVAGVVLLLHAAGAAALLLPRDWASAGTRPPERLAALFVLLFLATLMLSTAMSRIVAAFHERRDLDLLMAAPIPPMLILGIRAVVTAVAVAAVFGIVVVPLANVGVASGRWWMARFYLLLPLLAMAVTGIALLVTGAVVRLVGIRRARVGLQVFSALTGASMYLVSQGQQFIPRDTVRRFLESTARITQAPDPPVPLAFLIGVVDGQVGAWLVFAAGSIGLFTGATWLARRRFHAVSQAPDAGTRARPGNRIAIERRIATGFGRGALATLLVKEWRSIVRAPQLLSQILLQLLYLLPLLFIAFSRDGAAFARVGWGGAGIVALAGTLATSLGWLTVSAEDAPDLMVGSPQKPALILAAKLLAATLPPVALVVVAVIGTLSRAPSDAGLVLLFGVLACVSAAILAAASPATGKRSDFQRRHKGRGPMAIVEALQFLLWAGAAGSALNGYPLVAVGLTAAAMVTPAVMLPRALARFRSKARSEA